MKKLAISTLFSLVASSALAMDNGPRVVACEWTSKSGHSDVDICLIVSQGRFSGGVETTALRIGIRPELYLFEKSLVKIYESSSVDTPPLWVGRFSKDETQCRPAGRTATRYSMSNGTVLCLYGD